MTFSIRKTKEKGFGLFANHDLVIGETILEEEPLASCQFSWNKLYKYLACDYCLKSLESAEEMGRRLLQNSSISFPHPECCMRSSIHPVLCPQCEVVYCSERCREKAFNEYHKILCPFSQHCNPSEYESLDEVWRSIHFPPETATVWLLARLMARVKLVQDKAEFISTVEEFCHQCRDDSQKIIHKLLGDQFKDQLNVLRESLRSLFYSEEIAHWFTVEGFQSLFALLGTNQQGIGSSSLSVWVKNCDDIDLPPPERHQLDAFIDGLYVDLEQVAGAFLDCEGAGLYRLQSKCNHSCSPNAEVCFLHNNHSLTLRATTAIKAGDEITISYLSDCEVERSRHSRQKHLRDNYLFTCKCEKCLLQNNDPDVTSESESDDDDGMTDDT